MVDKDDWRLSNQMNYLFQKQLYHMPYTSLREGWDHDHCDFCSETIDASTGKAYCTINKYHWICETCYNDFKEMFEWELE